MQKKNTTLGLFGLLLAIFIAVSGCDTGGNGGTGSDQGFLSLARMDIEDAHNLFITPEPETPEDQLYKITDSGNVEKVKYFDDKNNRITELQSPSSIFVLNKDYIIISYKSGINYLVNSSTGVCYKYTNDLPEKDHDIWNDGDGNLYFLVNKAVKKLSLAKMDNIIISTVSAPTDAVQHFVVDKAGNIAYQYDGSFSNFRIRKNSGGYVTWDVYTSYYPRGFWTDFDGNLCFMQFVRYEEEYSPDTYLDGDFVFYKLILDPFTAEKYGAVPNVRKVLALGNRFKIKNKKIIIALDWLYLTEIYNGNTNQTRYIDLSNNFSLLGGEGLKSINLTMVSDNYLYFLSDNRSTIVKVDTSNYSCTILFKDVDLEIYKMAVSSNDVITINAMNWSKGVIVIGEISASDVVRILDATLTSEVVVLERIR